MSPTPTAPSQRLSSRPTVILPGGEPFFFPAGRTGCLLIHGFTGTPFEMGELGEHLVGRGFTVLAPRLFAHATRQEDMPRARWQDWLASVQDGYALLAGGCDRIVPVGLSMGGVLALLLAASEPVAGVAALSTPLHSPDPRMRLLRPIAAALTRLWRYADKPGDDFADRQAAADHLEYPQYPLRAVAELHDVIQSMRRRLGEIQCPALVVHARQDRSVPFGEAAELLARLGSIDKTSLWLDQGGHVVTRDADRLQVFAAVEAFARRCERGGP